MWQASWISGPRCKALASVCLAVASIGEGRSPVTLPVFLEDSHAGSFYWIAENVPLDEPHTLVLFDAHSDASQVFDSDEVRADLRRPRTMRDLRRLTAEWREAGAIQCFNWIEPLMPLPLAEVVWVAPGEITEERRRAMRAEIDRELNAHEMVAPRAGGPLAPRFTVASLEELRGREFAHPVIVSLDLDFFAESGEGGFGTVWNSIVAMPRLRAITAAISTPYLASQEQAASLVRCFLEEAGRITNATIEFDPAARTGPDRSRKARELRRAGRPVPAFDASQLENTPRIFVPGHTPDFDGCVRVRGGGFRIRLREDADDVEWHTLSFEHDVYNLMGSGTRFAAGAPWIQRLVATPLVEGRNWIDAADLPEETGTIRVQARVARVGSNVIILRRSQSPGMRGALEEGFHLPYVLGGSLLPGGPDRAEGGDCANFAVYALRRSRKRSLPWCTPPQFERYTEVIDGFAPGDEEDGIFVSFGSHLAVLWEDRPPRGAFNPEDRFAHHLEGLPEIVSLEELERDRRPPRFLRLRETSPTATLVFGGDVMLARSIGERIRAEPDFDPFSHTGDLLRRADLAVINLECALTDPRPGPARPFLFQAPVQAAGALSRAGIDVVSLANNHSGDGGEEGYEGTLRKLRSLGIDPVDGPVVSMTEIGGLRIAVTGLEPDDSLEPVREASDSADFVAVMTHWGVEHTREIQPAQRAFAAELVEAGADLVVGTGPHAPQAADRIRGRPVFYSTGNLVFDEQGPGPDWKRGYLVVVDLDEKGRILEAERVDTRIPH